MRTGTDGQVNDIWRFGEIVVTYHSMKTIRNTFFLGLLLVLLSLATGCGNRQTAAVLDDVETYIQARPDSALAVLRAIDTTTLNSRRLQAHYALLHAMA